MVCGRDSSQDRTVGSAYLVALRWINVVTQADFIQDDVHSITETIEDTETGVVASRTLNKTDVVFDTLQTSPLIRGGHYRHNIRVAVPSTAIVVKGREYRYQLTIVPDDGSGDPDVANTQKTDVRKVRGV
jgi:hypothetical protein